MRSPTRHLLISLIRIVQDTPMPHTSRFSLAVALSLAIVSLAARVDAVDGVRLINQRSRSLAT